MAFGFFKSRLRKVGLSRTKFACRKATGFSETSKGDVAALSAFNDPAGKIAAVGVLLGPDR